MKLYISTLFALLFITINAQEINAKIDISIETDDYQRLATEVENQEAQLTDCFVFNNEYSDTLLALAIKNGKTDIFNNLLSAGADVEQICQELTPLMYAAKYNRVEMLQTLLQNGADKTKTTSNGKTAYDFAVSQNYSAIIEILE